VAWVETTSPHFAARHELADEEDVVGVLEQLEAVRADLARRFGPVPDETAVVVHGSAAQLDLAQPYLPLLRRMTAPAARRYLAGWFAGGELHVLAPRVLEGRSSRVPGSQEMLDLAPATLYAHLVVGTAHPRLPPPFTPRSFARYTRWAWLPAGAAAWLSGQSHHARPAIARRMHEGPRPDFPPGVRDAPLLGGSLFDLLAREEGDAAAVALARAPLQRSVRRMLVEAFHGRPFVHTEATWRAQLERAGGRGRELL
jgi:hypothetical protein